MLVLSRSVGQSLATGQAARLTVVRIGAADADIRVDGGRAMRVDHHAARGMKPGTTFAMQRFEQLSIIADGDEQSLIRVTLVLIGEHRVRLGVEAPAGVALTRVD